MIRMLTAAALLFSACAARAQDPVVATASGPLVGTMREGLDVFRGIPYAAAPVGDLRWRPPAAPTRWTGKRPARNFGADCMQVRTAPFGRPMAEDCLFLNVWRPAGLRAGAKRSVMVWIHGGGLVGGSASDPVYDGAAFARQGLVFVSLNYRLGRLGFFAHPALSRETGKGQPLGNYGYLDQMAALRWVRQNIGHFGGDPAAVTVFGESSGGGSVVTLLTSPLARGLFSRAIVMSGGGRWGDPILRYLSRTSPGGVPSAEAVGVNFARSIGIDGQDADAMAKLRALSAGDAVAGQTLMTKTASGDTHVGRSFVDGVVMPESQEASIARGSIARVPVMVGTTNADLGFFTQSSLAEVFASFGANAAAARAAYDPAATLDFKAIATAVAMDQNMTEPARFIAQAVTAKGSPAYFYRFSYVAQQRRSAWSAGAPHGSELPFVFDTLDAAYGKGVTPEDRAVAREANRAWAAFALTGKPAASSVWPALRAAPDFVMDFRERPFGGVDPWKRRLDLTEAKAAFHVP